MLPRISWLDPETADAVADIIASAVRHHLEVQAAILFGSVARHDERTLLSGQPSDVGVLLLVDPTIVDRAATRLSHEQELALTNTIGEADYRHRNAPRAVQVLFAYRDLAGWDPAFIENVARDGLLIWARGPLPAPLAPVATHAIDGDLAPSTP